MRIRLINCFKMEYKDFKGFIVKLKSSELGKLLRKTLKFKECFYGLVEIV